MERAETGYENPHNAAQNIAGDYEVCYFIIKCIWVAHGTTDYVVRWEDNDCSGHGTVEKHIQKELVVVETDAIGNPRTMMVHFQDASVALRAMVTSVRLRLEAPLTNSHATKLFLFNWDNLLTWSCLFRFTHQFTTFIVLLAGLVAGYGSLDRIQILIVFMLQILWILFIVFDDIVSKLLRFIGFCTSLLNNGWLLSGLISFITTLTICLWVSIHVPFFLLRYITRISYYSPNNRNQKHGWRETKQHSKEDCPMLMFLCLLLWLPHGIKTNMWVVLSYCWIQIKVAIEHCDINIQTKSNRDWYQWHQLV